MIASHLKVNPALLRQITPNDVNPNGRVNEASLERDYEMYRAWGYIPTPVSLAALIDRQYVDRALQVLGTVSG